MSISLILYIIMAVSVHSVFWCTAVVSFLSCIYLSRLSGSPRVDLHFRPKTFTHAISQVQFFLYLICLNFSCKLCSAGRVPGSGFRLSRMFNHFLTYKLNLFFNLLALKGLSCVLNFNFNFIIIWLKTTS